MVRRTVNAGWGPLDSRESVPGAGLFAMRLMLASLSVPFLAIVVCYLKMRHDAFEWLPTGPAERPASAMPAVLWVSTGLLVVLSACCQVSLWLIRAYRDFAAKLAAAGTLFLGLAFLGCQLSAWLEIQAHLPSDAAQLQPYRAAFAIVTGLHALHVIGGVLVQAFVIFQAVRLPYWSLFHPGLHYSAMYWHFLGATWIVLFAMILLCS